MTSDPKLFRALIAASLGAAADIFAFALALGVTHSKPAATILGLFAAILVALWVFTSERLRFDVAACSTSWKAVAAVGTIAALIELARLGVFMGDPTRVSHSAIPSSRWEVEHSCLTAYHVAAKAAASPGVGIYDNALYSAPDDDPAKPRKAKMLGAFKLDVYEYPPQFLLAPRVLQLLTPRFEDLRLSWFGVSGGLLLLAFVAVAGALGPAAGTRALLLSPLIWIAIPTLSTVQKGNVQLLVIAGSMVAMLLFARGRPVAGGALLAFMTVSKLYPGLLILYLMVRRDWRAVSWTAAFGAGISLLTLATFGLAPYAAFLDHFPGLIGGEAFPAFRNIAAKAINLSIPGLVFKLGIFGVPGMTFGVSKVIGWLYTLVAVVATVLAARRSVRDGESPLVWLAILILATLRSPFLPLAYGTFPAMWLLTLVVALRGPSIRTLALTIAAWLALCVYWPIDWPVDPRWLALASTIPQTVMIVLAVHALRRRAPAPTEDLADAAPAFAAA